MMHATTRVYVYDSRRMVKARHSSGLEVTTSEPGFQFGKCFATMRD
jgi:hypothetical protein